MSRSEFRYNKKRKHYSYLFKDVGTKRKCILISSKSIMVIKKNRGGKKIIKNILLFHHPNANKEGIFYLIPKIYIDEIICFDERIYQWFWDKNDKRKVKRIKKKKI